MSNTKHLLLTFDYELFLGENSGTPENCLLKPTEKLLNTFRDIPVRMIFFVDTTYLIQLKKQAKTNEKCNEDYNKIKVQIQKLIKLNHYIFPHIHPHWLDAIYNEEKNIWNLSNTEKYRFQNLEKKEQNLLFSQSINILEEIIYPIKSDYKINSYRAGGWCIQPFDDFKEQFTKHNIKYDFSVTCGGFSFTDVHYYDFRKYPSKEAYKFENDVVIKKNDGSFIEFPISRIKTDLTPRRIEKLFKLSIYKYFLKPYGDGTGANAKETPPSEKISPEYDYQVASLESFRLPLMYAYKNLVSENTLLHFISHPKLLTFENLKFARYFFKKLFKKHKIKSDFEKIKAL